MLDYAKWKIYLVTAVCALGMFFALPNVLPNKVMENAPSWWSPVNLGLDLQGGSQLLLEVKYQDVIKEQLNSISSDLRYKFRSKNIRYSSLKVSDDNVLSFKLLSKKKSTQVLDLIKDIEPASLIISKNDNIFTLKYNEQAIIAIRLKAVDQSIEVVRKRIDELGTKEPSIQRQGDNRIIVQLPGVQNPEMVKELLGKTAKLSFHLVDETSVQDAKRGKISPSSYISKGKNGSSYVLQRSAVITGAQLVDARTGFDETNSAVVSFKLNSIGARKFGAVTSENIGRRLAIVLDGKVIQAPNINSAITGGSGQISGGFTVESANELSMLLRAGALPAELQILEERTVGPGLGTDSIEAGKFACMVGLSLVVLVIFLMYGKLGTFVNISVIMNIMLMIGVQSLMGATLTLPGIAGIVLSMGIGVDANILIFERMREEKGYGRSVLNTITAGFDNAFSAIIDGQLTTLSAGLILLSLGSGPVKGFGVTLTIGIFTSLFTSIMLTRLLLTAWVYNRRPETLTI
jgi:protein-export membrane protein SecD